ncbi:MAG TPA: hypothetical protein VM008_01740 [Phycisphaerae bacterium]|nr:hypothetical protein [Phycisphaerae bacterium]
MHNCPFPRLDILILGLATSCLFAPAASAQTRPADFDPSPMIKQLADADAAQGAAVIEKLTVEQVPAFIASFDPDSLRSDARDAIMQSIAEKVRKARDAQFDAFEALDNDWDSRTGLPTYKANGAHDPAWDKLAADALESSNKISRAAAAKKFRAAVDAGCTDPLIRYYDVRRSLDMETITPEAALARYRAILPDLDKSPYTPARKFQIRIRILSLCINELAHDPQTRPIAEEMWNGAVHLLPTLASEMPSPLLVREAIAILQKAGTTLGHDRKTDYDKINPHLATLLPNSTVPYAYAAEFYTKWAWDARGGGWASSVTEKGWKLFGQRLSLAEEAATNGANLDPLDGECPAKMIAICMGKSYDRPTMEKWFNRAMLADPDNYDACHAKYYFLLPEWGGSIPDVLAFGRECLKTGTVQSRIPVILLDIHSQLAQDSGQKDAYYAQPEVWKDIDAVYKKLLFDPSRVTTDHKQWLFDRAKYIKYAYTCHQWQTVLTLMDQYKDDVDMQVFGGKTVYNFYKKKATQQLTKSPV